MLNDGFRVLEWANNKNVWRQGDNKKEKFQEYTKNSRKILREIAEAKMADLNTNNIDAATRIVEGTAKSMGLEIKD